MKLNTMLLAGIVLFGFGSAVDALAADCPWQQPWVDYGRNPNGGACRDAGLDTHGRVCVRGYKYELLCDDRRNPSSGRPEIKVCNGQRICERNGSPYPPYQSEDED